MKTFNGTEQIGAIVAQFAGSSNLFQRYQIDFCCGGQRKLSTVLDKQDIDNDIFLKQLNEAYAHALQQHPDRDWRQASYSDLIAYVINNHHAYLMDELPILSEFLTKLLRVHGAKHPELATLHRLFHALKIELEQHLISEEELVFPSIQQYEQTGSIDAKQHALKEIKELEAEHELAGDLLKEMRSITNQYALPEGACTTYRLAFEKLEKLEADMFQHIHLENNIMFPRLLEEEVQ